MKILCIGLDNRALNDEDGHSKRWNTHIGQYVERIDVIVEMRERSNLAVKKVTDHFNLMPVYTPHPLLYPFMAYRAALRAHERDPYDLVTCEDPFRPGLAAYWFKRATAVPLNVGYHTETFFNQDWLNDRPVINRVYDWIGRRVVRGSDSIRCVNFKNRDQIARIFGPERNPLIDVVPSPAAFYQPELHDAPARALRERLLGGQAGVLALFVGRLAAVKKLDELLPVFAKIEERFPQAHLVLAGDGVERPRLEKLAASLNLKRVHFVGYVSEEEIPHWYGACDLFVNACHVETFGRVFIEAMSAGKPVITTSGAGAVEQGLCIDHDTALVYKPGDLAGLERALTELVGSEELRRKIGARGLEQVRVKFNYDRNVLRVIDLWERTLLRTGRTIEPKAPRLLQEMTAGSR